MVSVVIPCFNQGGFVDEAIQSVLAQTHQDLEIIVVNPGSTDPATVSRLNALQYEKTRVIHSENRGPSSARNVGIREACGEFILPLDADDKIAPSYLEKSLEILKARPEVGIVYCEADLFGDQHGKWDLPKYQFPEILISPRIHCSGVFARKDWETVGGYSDEFVHGWEDHDFWLSLIELGREVYCIPEPLFHYRKHPQSRTVTTDRRLRSSHSFEILFRRHQQLYVGNLGKLFGSGLLGETRQEFSRLKQRNEELEQSLELRIGRGLLWPFRKLAKRLRSLRRSISKRLDA